MRFSIVAMLFAVTIVNYAGPVLSKDLGLSAVEMGFVFSAFGWSYVIGQIPGGWLLDRFGSKKVYFFSIFIWSLFTLLQGEVAVVGLAAAAYALFVLRLLVGFAEAPSFPANGRIVAAWFPARERGTASAIFNSAQYFATVLFAPIMGWLTFTYGWPSVFYFMGFLGILVSFVWLKVIYDPKDHPRITQGELRYLEEGGALVNMDQPAKAGDQARAATFRWSYLADLVSTRMMLGIYLGQFCINALTYFFITWFPIYLVQARGMSIMKVGFVAALPAICGFLGGVCSGMLSDALLRRGISLSAARKTPFVLGMALATTLVACNFVQAEWAVIAIMALAFFGKGLAAIGWAVISDAAPKEITGLTGGMFNAIGNIAGIVTPIVSGYIIVATGAYDGVLLFVAAHAVLAILAYLFLMGPIRRLTLRQD